MYLNVNRAGIIFSISVLSPIRGHFLEGMEQNTDNVMCCTETPEGQSMPR